ncbi:hypothetical protein ACE4ZE_04670 [Enterococcus faecium]|uniref:hypothetical protein n=1 Tax=Enterococcus faecium TaxID=1352 RepID=UPI000CF2814E|nr:hypothetical protein [Enterococcus faecium]PQF77046.1 hypothetical protein CUS65_08315 [Enterococcus faecium]
MKILYFNIFLYKNGKKTNYKINELIDFISRGTALQRTKKLDDDKVVFLSKTRLNRVGRNGSLTKEGYEFIEGNRTVWIGKFNSDRPYTGVIGSDNIEPIVGDLYQPNVCLAIPDNYLFLIEYNFLGPSRRQVEKFLTSFISSNSDENSFEVKLVEIKKESMLELVSISDSIKSVTITVNNEGFELGNFFVNLPEKNGLLARLFMGPIEASNEMDVNQTTIILKKGRRKKEMDITEIGEILNLVNINSDNLVSAVVEFINPKTKLPDKFDLKHDGYYTGFKDSRSYTGFEILADLMTAHYYEDERRSKDRYYHQYLDEGIENIVANEFTLIYPNDDFNINQTND